MILVALGTCMAAVSGWRYARASAPVNGPIILISIDSLRADHLPAYGYRGVRTPALDALAADGVVFEHAYSHVPQTLPAHAALLTGRLPFETGVRDSAGFTIKGSERLLSEMLRDRGFATAGVVSSYLLRKDTGISKGFGFFDATFGDDGAGAALRRDGTDSERIAEQWLDTSGTTRAFLFLHIDEPRRPPAGSSGAGSPSSYDDRIAQADRVVGRLVQHLKAHQRYDQSTVIILSDHGEGLGDHREDAHGLLVYEESLHVPLIMKQPAGDRAGRRVSEPVQLIDIVPTILELAKAPVPGSLSGRSLKPLLEQSGQLAPRMIYAESMFGAYRFGWTGYKTITDGRYRYIAGEQEELYDLRKDPGQRANLVGSQPDALTTWRGALKKIAAGTAPGAASSLTADDRSKYEALGYVGNAHAGARRPAGITALPEQQAQIVEQYRAAMNAAASQKWTDAIDGLRILLRDNAADTDLWLQLAAIAARAERHAVALDAYRHVIELQPDDHAAQLAAAMALLKLRKYDEAKQHAETVARDDAADASSRAVAHEVLARVALSRHDTDVARAEALEAEQADASRPVRAYVDGRIAFDLGRYADALEAFEQALETIGKSKQHTVQDLRVYAADTLVRLSRNDEAEYLLVEELKDFPGSARARSSLAALYRSAGRLDEAAGVLAEH